MAIEKLYSFGEQTFSYGMMWSWTTQGLPSWMYPWPNGYDINPYQNGSPFNLIEYFQKNGGIPDSDTRLFFNDSGACEEADATFTIWCINYSGGKYFGCHFGATTLATAQAIAQNCITYGQYNGCDPTNITQLDINFANVWMYENTVPNDYTLNGYVSPGPFTSGDRWRLLMLGWATNPVDDITPADEYEIDTGTTVSDHFVPKANENDHINGGYYPRTGASQGWIAYSVGHLPESLFKAIETWEDVPQETGGGGSGYGYYGEFDGIDSLRILDFADLGFTSMYAPSKNDLKQLSKVLWNDTFLDAMEKSAVGDPMDAIISLVAVPLYLGNIVGQPEMCYIGKYNTGIAMNPLTQTSIRIDCGMINVPETWHTATDYSSCVEIYIPYVGMVQVNISEVMAGSIHLFYDVNLMSGDFCAKVEIVNRYMGQKATFTIYQHEGNLQTTIPVTGANYSQYYKNRVGGAAQIMSALASGVSGNVMGAVQGVVGGLNQMLTPPTISRSGNLSGASALMALRVPKIIITKHNQYVPNPAGTFGPLKGMPAFYPCKIKDLSGFNAVDDVRLQNFPGSDEEQDELIALMKEGVFF